jgi:hypothetical protein
VAICQHLRRSWQHDITPAKPIACGVIEDAEIAVDGHHLQAFMAYRG